MSPSDPVSIRTFYRIVWTDPPGMEDARPHVERNVVIHVDNAEIRRLATGISVFRTFGQAKKTARKRLLWLGSGFIARTTVPPGATARIERTTKTTGHYTIWAEADDILRWIEGIVPVTSVEDERNDL